MKMNFECDLGEVTKLNLELRNHTQLLHLKKYLRPKNAPTTFRKSKIRRDALSNKPRSICFYFNWHFIIFQKKINL